MSMLPRRTVEPPPGLPARAAGGCGCKWLGSMEAAECGETLPSEVVREEGTSLLPPVQGTLMTRVAKLLTLVLNQHGETNSASLDMIAMRLSATRVYVRAHVRV